MSLRDYQRKRDFSRTAEPAPASRVPKGRAIFVVQLHHASHRHFDFRLQVGNTLKSWAVPKGPSYDPSVKRLAVEVEDHPVSYADFEGDIKEGYGKGHVDQFDRGVWSTEGDVEAQLQKGHLRFELYGKRLKGGWHLVRSGRKERQPAWFLIKEKDGFASELEADDLLDARMVASTRRAAKSVASKAAAGKVVVGKGTVAKARRPPLAALRKRVAKIDGARKAKITDAFFPPELARLRDHPPHGAEWVHEVKWDGYRILTSIANGKVKLWSRNALPWNDKIPDIVQAIAGLGLADARLDGELIALHEGRSDFNMLQKTLSGEALTPLVYMLFDIPHFEGFDLSHATLLDRKALLEGLLAHAPDRLAVSRHFTEDGDAVFAMAMEQKLEGIMSKRADGGYRPGRGDDWLKIKRLDSDEFAVVGYTPAKGSRSGFGSLLLARPDKDGGWIYAGRVGTGFSASQLQALGKTLATKGRKEPTVRLAAIDPLLRGALWVPPTAVAEVYFRGIGNQGLLRQPSLKTLREDKMPKDLSDSDRAPVARAPAKKAASRRRPSGKEPDVAPINLTHPERVVFPDDGITKQEVFDYYAAAMKWFLPGVVDRPMSVIRCPEGTAKPCFFQKHPIQGLKHVASKKLKEESGAQALYLYPTDADSILELVQFGVLEFHPWGATIADPDRADRIVFDFDPGPGVPWARVTAAAQLLRKLLKQLSLESFLRTTGGKGLHVVVPLRPACKWPQVKDFAQGLANTLVQLHPLEFLATASKEQRNGKIFVDYLRNTRGATSVASYSLRARPGAPVAVPLRWTELGKLTGGDAFDLHSTLSRLSRLRTDPWEGIGEIKQNLDEVMSRLAKR
jgi:bifunctional non-homologous end joining protein LigD